MELDLVGGETIEAPKYAVRHYEPLSLRASSPGGGRWGNPRHRDPERVLRDVRDGVVSNAAAESIYGVIIDQNGKCVDQAATIHLRNRQA